MDNKTFELVRSDGYQTLKLIGNIDSESISLLEKECIPQCMSEPICHLVLSFENISEVSPALLRFLIQLQKKIKSVNKLTRIIFANPSIEAFLTQQGVNEALAVKSSLRSALVDFGLVTAKALDVNFINPFLSATMTVLKVQAQTESKAGQPFKRGNKENYLGDISGIIGLVSEAFTGSVVISFPAQTFLKVISRMLGEECKEINKDIQDGAGELTNIIFGQAKVVLNEKGYGIRTAIPSVVSGKDHAIQNISNGPRMTVPFTSDAGDFFIEICLSE